MEVWAEGQVAAGGLGSWEGSRRGSTSRWEGRGRGGEISGKGERGRREDKAEGGGKCRRTHSQPLTEYCMQFALGPVRRTYIHTCCPGIPGGCTTGGRMGYITWF